MSRLLVRGGRLIAPANGIDLVQDLLSRMTFWTQPACSSRRGSSTCMGTYANPAKDTRRRLRQEPARPLRAGLPPYVPCRIRYR